MENAQVQGTQVVCEGCGSRSTVHPYVEGKTYRCTKCRGELIKVAQSTQGLWQPAAKPPSIEVMDPEDVSAGKLALADIVNSTAKKPSVLTHSKAQQGGGQKLGGIKLVRELGRGGMGIVYEGVDETLRRRLALKVLLSADEPNMKERFLREARLVSKLKHPNIVGVHSMGEDNGKAYFTMDYIEGGSLNSLFTPHVPAQQLLQLIAPIARALDYAHQNQVMHRDIKPQNILVSKDGVPFLTDFGLAREATSNTRLTMSGAVMGTPSYMSPEQASGRAADHRTDIYSLGAVMYEGLTGKAPFEYKELLVLLDAICREDPWPPSRHVEGIPRDAETICLKALAKQPDRRYQTAGEMADDIERFLRGESIEARRSGILEKGQTWLKRRPAVAIGGGVGLLAILVIGVMMKNSIAKSRLADEEAAASDARHKKELADLAAEADRKQKELNSKLASLQARYDSETDPEKKAALKRELDAQNGHVAVADSGWANVDKQIDAMLSSPKPDYAAAMTTLKAWPSDKEKRDSKVKVVRDAAQKHFDKVKADAKALEDGGKLKDAADAWRTLIPIGVEELSEIAKSESSRLDAAVAAATTDRKKFEAELFKARTAFVMKMRLRDVDGAKHQGASLRGLDPSLKQDADDLEWAASAWEKFNKEARAAFDAGGDEVTVRTYANDKAATFKKWGKEKDQLWVTYEGGAQGVIDYDDIRAEELIRLATARGVPEEGTAFFWYFLDPRDAETASKRREWRTAMSGKAREAAKTEPAKSRVLSMVTALDEAMAVLAKMPKPPRPTPPEGWKALFDGESTANFAKATGVSLDENGGVLLVDNGELATTGKWAALDIEFGFEMTQGGRVSGSLRGCTIFREDVNQGLHRVVLHTTGPNAGAEIDGRQIKAADWRPGAAGPARIRFEGAPVRVIFVNVRELTEEVIQKPPPDKPPDRPPDKPPVNPPPPPPPQPGPGPGPGKPPPPKGPPKPPPK